MERLQRSSGACRSLRLPMMKVTSKLKLMKSRLGRRRRSGDQESNLRIKNSQNKVKKNDDQFDDLTTDLTTKKASESKPKKTTEITKKPVILELIKHHRLS